MSDNDLSDFVWGFITGVLIRYAFRLVWFLIKLLWCGLVLLVDLACIGVQRLRERRERSRQTQADGLGAEGVPGSEMIT